MARHDKSIRGEMIDFDLISLKSQISDTPRSTEAEDRERFVYSKRRRGTKRTVEEMLDAQKANVDKLKSDAKSVNPLADKVDVPTKAKKVTTKRKIIKKDK